MLTRRLQILLDEERYERLARRAAEQETSIAALVRRAVDATFPPAADHRPAAARDILQADPMPVPDVAELVAELEQLRSRRW